MITIHLMGGLGNQLFQIATTIAYCIQNKTDFVLPYSETLTTGVERPTYWNNLLKGLKKFTTEENPAFYNDYLQELPQYREPDFRYREIPENLENIQLWGYYQSYKYFDQYRTQVLSIMGLDTAYRQIRDEYPEWFGDGRPTISIHFRLGDYKEKQQYHPVLPYEYYDRAMAIIPREYLQYARILYFCEEEDRAHANTIMAQLYEKYGTAIPICIGHDIPDWKQMLIMSNCQINIIANSSYSWWAAYLNEDAKKTVIYPSVWFGPAIPHIVDDLFPESWIRVSM